MRRNHLAIASATACLAGTLLLFGIVASPALAQPPTCSAPWQARIPNWDHDANQLGSGPYHQLEYPLAFVAVAICEDPISGGFDGNYHHGTDVLSANNPDSENHLWVLTPGATSDVKKLFPLDIPEHDAIIDTPQTELWKGSVLEPNVSEDGRRLYFGYVHDTTDETFIGNGIHKLPWSGADLYALDIGPLVDDPDFPPEDLDSYRLTVRHEVEEHAMNPTAAEDTVSIRWAPTYMHAVEMRTADGLKLVYSSDERSLQNSNKNFSLGEANHNFNLHIADLVETASGPELHNRRQLQYYTTTSAMSPAPMRDGISFSYQASTTEPRQWQTQLSDSVGRWNTLLGYGANQFAVHLGTFCVAQNDGDDITGGTGYDPGDFFIAARYYNQNNEGFGLLERQSLAASDLGLNTYDNPATGGDIPLQVGNKRITKGVGLNDQASGKIGRDYIGKFTSPRCGKPDELFMAYTPTSANGNSGEPPDDEGHRDRYRSMITFRDSFEEFEPITDQQIVVRDAADQYSLVWPTPVISWLDRTGTDAEQQYQESIVDPDTPILAGIPHAQIGTAELYNTDRKPFDCWLGEDYLPSDHHFGNEVIHVVKNQDGLTQVQPGGPCADLSLSNVLGVAINITSNKVQGDFAISNDPDVPGYETGGWFGGDPMKYFSGLELSRQLGVYDIRDQMHEGSPDASFQALIPAKVPFELMLLDADYGLKLADVRSWHSLQPRETRTDCGGCHQHDQNAAQIPGDFEDTYAATMPAQDFVNETPHIEYDTNCTPEVVTTPTPESTRAINDWAALWTEFDASCGRCHNTLNQTDPQDGTGAFAYNSRETAYRELNSKWYANPVAGALGSPAFWAARGVRTDGRSDTPYIGESPSFIFSTAHASAPEIVEHCNGDEDTGDPQWVYDFGQWIDHHMPRDNINALHEYSYERDWYHPTIDFAISTKRCNPTKIRIGHWDDSGGLRSLEVLIDGVREKLYVVSDDLSNAKGKRIHKFTTPGMTEDSSVTVIGLDSAGNRQVYSKSIRQLEAECVPSGVLPYEPVPWP